MMRKLATIGGTIGIFVLGFGLIALLGSLKPEQESREAPPRLPAAFVEEVEYAPLELTVSAQGEVQPRREIALTPQVAGRIVEVSEDFNDGGAIRAGEVLVQLDDADYRSALIRARSRVAQAEQALAVERAEAQLAARDYKELAGEDADPSDLTLRRPQLASAEAAYEAARADLSDAELAVERARITAPFTGRVRSTSADIGQFVSPGTPLGQVFSTELAEVRMPLTDQDLARLDLPIAFDAPYGEGPEVAFTAQAAGRTRRWTGHVVRTDAAIDPTTRQISVIAQVRDPYGEGADYGSSESGFPMAIGLFVDAEIAGPTLERAVVLPRLAVQDGSVVHTLDEEDRLVRKRVSVAASTPIGVVVTDGLSPGERVLVSRPPAAAGTVVRPLTPGAEVPSGDADDARAGTAARASGGQAASGASR